VEAAGCGERGVGQVTQCPPGLQPLGVPAHCVGQGSVFAHRAVHIGAAAPKLLGMPNKQLIPWIIVAIVVIAALGYFGYQKHSEHQEAQKKDQLSAQVKQSMQEKFNGDPQFSKYDIHVQKIMLIKESGNKYNGIATVVAKSGSSHEVMIDVTDDGQNLLWQSQPGAFMFLVQEQLAG
jgi:hypothetical protein